MILDILTFAGPHRIAQLRWIGEDGGYVRETRCPGADLSDLDDDTRAAIDAEWTDAVCSAYRAALAAAQSEIPEAVETRDLAAEIDALKDQLAAQSMEVASLRIAVASAVTRK